MTGAESPAPIPRLRAFPPLVAAGAHTLILGSMPGAASLAAGEYYAHPRNLFWPFMSALCGVATDASYAARTAAFTAAGFALWDVLAACTRAGSLDAAIVRDSIEVNDFARFFADHPGIERIFCNGTTAHTLFVRHVAGRPGVPATVLRLPSTSQANASQSLASRRAAWQAVQR